ncbi:MAG: glycosyltransferase [Acidimicrobiales bacterium]
MTEAAGPGGPSSGTGEGRHLKVAMYSGIVVRRDAVSWSLLHKLAALRRLIALGAPIDVTVFAQSIEDQEPEFVCCPSVAKLLARPEFWEADLHIYEEGMYYELFDSVYLVELDRPILAIEHNSTPAALVDVPPARLAVERSHAQRRNLVRATRVACVSELNVEMARSAGVPEEAISVLHLPPAIVPIGPVPPLAEGRGPIRLLYLGRFVRAKGIADMVELTTRLVTDHPGRFHVTLAGDPRFSDAALLEAATGLAESNPDQVELVLAPDDAAMAGLFGRSDALVIPSYHEGYCVPVVEALGFGRFVVAYAAGNLPNIVGGLGLLVPTGDVGALGDAVLELANAIDSLRSGGEATVPTAQGPMTAEGWSAAVRRHLGDYSAANFERRFLSLFEDLALGSPAGRGPELDRAITKRRHQLAGVD